jgi:hypothetical protein
LSIDARAFTGGCPMQGQSGLAQGRGALLLYGQRSDCPQASAAFELPVQPIGPGTLTILAMSSPEEPPDIAVTLNDRAVFRGRSPAPGGGAWGEVSWQLPDGALRQGRNALTVANQSRGKQGQQPWLGLAGAMVSYR